MSISITPDVSQTLTFSVPQPNFYDVKSARLYIVNPLGRTAATISPKSTTKTTVVFEFSLTKKALNFFFDYSTCEFRDGRYQVVLTSGVKPVSPPTLELASGTVSISGPPFGGDCGGEDPPPDDPPPGGGDAGDSPYGPIDSGDRLPSVPPPPGSPCLPPSFVAPAPGVPTPCG